MSGSDNFLYTEKMYDKLWEQESDADDLGARVQSFLCDNQNFRTFGDGLSALIAKKFPEEATSPQDFLKKRFQEKNLPLNRNTVNNWFSAGKRPKKSEDSREKMFLIAFALELTTEETAGLFHKVYLDRSFNPRSKREFIYFYCIEQHKSYEYAQKLLAKAEDQQAEAVPAEGTIQTCFLQNDLQSMGSDADVLKYIDTHPHNFEINIRSAWERQREYLALAKKCVQEELKQIKAEPENELKGMDRNSNNFMFRMITGQSYSRKLGEDTDETPSRTERCYFQNWDETNRGTISLTGKLHLVNEIKNNFPQPQMLSKKDLTYEEMRKSLILLFSYTYWERVQEKHLPADFDGFESQLNDLLDGINFPPLYYGNPYDWLFLLCSLTDIPLDMFREILSVALDADSEGDVN